ncbi:MAG: ABC transporter permease [Bryobacterales bacterium]|nr:ABC transporter permease [Bryobacteraceae bacterium]MDW8355355.1 ABC transporter permease [Bryobacterales bacterium]
MSVGYSDPVVLPHEHAPRLRVTFRLENRSREIWRAADGFRVGCQIFDPATDLVVAEGPRQALPQDLAPGQSAPVDLEVPLPRIPGGYRLFVSPMQEEVCWHYERWPFLLVDVTVEGGRIAAGPPVVTTLRALRRRHFAKSLARALIYPVRTLWRHRSLIRSMARRDVAGRYRGSFAGLFWTVLNPLLLVLTYFFVFGIVLRTRFGTDPSRAGFALYFLAGMLPWLPFSEALGRAPSVLLEHRTFVKKLVFPLEILPTAQVAAGLVTQGFALAVFLTLLVILRGEVPSSAVWLPALLVPQVLLTLGLCWFLAALGVYVRDLAQVNGFLLTLWFFLTPICYPEASLPQEALWLLAMNPMFVLVRGFRAALLEGQAPAFDPLWKLWLAAAAVFVLGHAFFYRLRRNFADVI